MTETTLAQDLQQMMSEWDASTTEQQVATAGNLRKLLGLAGGTK